VDAQEELRASVQTIVAESAEVWCPNCHGVAGPRRAAHVRPAQQLWGRMARPPGGAQRNLHRRPDLTPSTIGDYLRSSCRRDGWLPDPLERPAPPHLDNARTRRNCSGSLDLHARNWTWRRAPRSTKPPAFPRPKRFGPTMRPAHLRVQIAARSHAHPAMDGTRRSHSRRIDRDPPTLPGDLDACPGGSAGVSSWLAPH